ncbi:FecR family protein [Nitrosomonas cryotolerans]|uniref:FecR family protein n=1 Tax=Nitrosomonas cryotolerans ATCC 49181 TaxID=1131553 RepID=A0A1N6I838_9PROT|nr:FecR family protein [Nitrosomonas cryotolerans]SFP97266.1 FecR family protein [Nitrosomonas cryotolerans]SIO28182.1 FecR family protein [Nitrosomonas cryotolerans ATCC 49181]
MPITKPPISSPHTFVFSWRRFLLHCTIIGTGMFLGLLAWYIANPQSTRLYETAADERLNIMAAPHIHIALDANSSVGITNRQPPQIEVLRGNVYFEIKGDMADKPEIKVGKAFIRNVGSRFSIQMHKDGNNEVAVAAGQAEIHVASGRHLISARERADFDGFNVHNHQLITGSDIAPWRVAH